MHTIALAYQSRSIEFESDHHRSTAPAPTPWADPLLRAGTISLGEYFSGGEVSGLLITFFWGAQDWGHQWKIVSVRSIENSIGSYIWCGCILVWGVWVILTLKVAALPTSSSPLTRKSGAKSYQNRPPFSPIWPLKIAERGSGAFISRLVGASNILLDLMWSNGSDTRASWCSGKK